MSAQDEIEYNQVYDCGDGKSKFKVLSCKGRGKFDRCDIFYINEYSPVGGFKDSINRVQIDDMMNQGCKIKGRSARCVGLRISVVESRAQADPRKPIYPVRATFSTCTNYRDAITTRKMERIYDCYVHKTGGWQCSQIGASGSLAMKDEKLYIPEKAAVTR